MSIWQRIAAWLSSGRSTTPPAATGGLSGVVPTYVVGEKSPTTEISRATLEKVQKVKEDSWQIKALAVGMTPRDVERLKGVHPDLIRVLIRARAAQSFFVAEGLRMAERQRELFEQKKTKTLNSKHMVGRAVDIYPFSLKPIPQLVPADYKAVVDAMREAARKEVVAMEHGYDWGWDSPHHELRGWR